MSSFVSDMINTIRRILGFDLPQRLNDAPAIEKRDKSLPPKEEKLYLGTPVPLEASHDPDDSKLYAELTENFRVAPANDGTSVLVFLRYFLSESPEDKSVVYDEYEMTVDRDRDGKVDLRTRSSDTVRLYDHLFRDRQPHPRVVHYLGPTLSGYRLERLSLGPVGPCTSLNSDAVLALRQRWALQILSALQWIHERGVTLQQGAIQQEAMWLRSDLSIAVAGFVTAGCLEIDVPADHWPGPSFIITPWSVQNSGHSAPPYDWCDTGLPKGDLFDWATWQYGLMIPEKCDPLLGGLSGLEHEEYITQLRHRTGAAEKGEFKDWPRLPKEQLGEVLIRAWNGEYETAQEVLGDARRTLEQCGRTLTAGKIDEIDGFDWTSLFEVGPGPYGRDELRLIAERKESKT